ncbi:unnamed protein product [Rhizoctonia solani]|uniref:Lysine-specific metallo-endopeptidase domain-containing protein n=1 Tax=Rhizoctonia solani TaxID=456999 RepID=A0A8H3BR24_9AGAM|nr:unnamed protein product [Rhizoctonia solani]
MFAAAVSVLLPALLVSANRSLSPKLGALSVNSTLTNGTITKVQIQEKHVFSKDAIDHSSGHFLSKRARYIGCTPDQQLKVAQAIHKVKQYASSSYDHLESNPSGSTLYTKWFGQFAPDRYARVLNSFKLLRTYPDKWAYSCNLCTRKTAIANVDEGNVGIDLCPGFWSESIPVEGFKSRAYFIIREGTRVRRILGTGKHKLTQELSMILATQNPTKAVESADNHASFSVEAHALTASTSGTLGLTGSNHANSRPAAPMIPL